MSKEQVKNIIDKSWKKAKALFHYPTLQEPDYKNIGGWAKYDFSENKTYFNPKLFSLLSEQELNYADNLAFRLSVHEIAHYMLFPFKYSNLLFLYKIVIDTQDEESPAGLVDFAVTAICDLIAFTLASSRDELEEEIKKHCREIEYSSDNEYIKAVYEIISDFIDYYYREEKTETKFHAEFESLSALDFMAMKSDIEELRKCVISFMNILNKLLDDFSTDSGPLLGDMKDKFNQNPVLDYLESDIAKAPEKTIENALKDLSKHLTRDEYKKLLELIENLTRKQIDDKRKIKMGESLSEIEISKEVIAYYRRIAKSHPISIRKIAQPTSKKYSSMGSTEKYRINSDPNLLLPFTSGGKINPGITRKVKLTYKTRLTGLYRVPDIIIAIDSSGSMPNPEEEKSPALIAAFCAALSFHKLGASIAVINFSGKTYLQPFTRNIDNILAALAGYQGGGTVLELSQIQKLLKNNKSSFTKSELLFTNSEGIKLSGKTDLIIISDLWIKNFDDIIDFIKSENEINFATIICGNEAESIPDSEKIAIYEHIKNEEDIVKITAGAANKYIMARHSNA